MVKATKTKKPIKIALLPNEIWEEVILDFEYPHRLAVSSMGRAQLFSLKIHDGRLINPNVEKNRVFLMFRTYYINENGNKGTHYHRIFFPNLIAKIFIPNPDNAKYILHKDGNRNNNAVSNLQYSRFRLAGSSSEKAGLGVKLESTEKAAIFYHDQNAERNYCITNYGRLFVYHKQHSDGRIIKPFKDGKGRIMVSITPLGDKRKSWLVHKLVAQYFLPLPLPDQLFIIHKDHNLENNLFTNLSWASQADKNKQTLEKKLKFGLGEKGKQMGQKLNVTQVIHIKRLLLRGKVRHKIIAKQFGISEMAIYRIKRGENWAHVTLDNL